LIQITQSLGTILSKQQVMESFDFIHGIQQSDSELSKEIESMMPMYSKYPKPYLLMGFLWIIFNIGKNIDLSEIFLSLCILVAAVIRILPAINRVMYNIGQVKFSKPSTDIVVKEFKNLDKIKNRNFLNKIDVIFKKEIFLKNLSFSYNKSKNTLLKNINLKINKGEKICFLGESGSGKSTLLDIISGLLNPTNGSILIDKKLIFNPRYQKLNLTYVQQDLSLLDGTIAENISFGEDFNKDKLIHSIKFSLLNKLMKEKKDSVMHQMLVLEKHLPH
jgi:ABC-type bacteriocin/lantibiotic exporter with double-glycine peptidase domain